MDLDLAGKHALVCGASEGIGRATAMELAALGADVTVLARRSDSLQALLAELPRRGSDTCHSALTLDIGDTVALGEALAKLCAERAVHIVVNNTGGPAGGPLCDAHIDTLLAVFRQHVLAAHCILQAVLPGMQRAGYGRIVNVISTSVKEPIAGLGVSNTIRGAMASWSKTLASELAPQGITVNNVLPGFTDTGRLSGLIEAKARSSGRDYDDIAREMRATAPAGRFARAEEPAAAIAFLASPAAAYINGINLPVDGGRTRSL